MTEAKLKKLSVQARNPDGANRAGMRHPGNKPHILTIGNGANADITPEQAAIILADSILFTAMYVDGSAPDTGEAVKLQAEIKELTGEAEKAATKFTDLQTKNTTLKGELATAKEALKAEVFAHGSTKIELQAAKDALKAKA